MLESFPTYHLALVSKRLPHGGTVSRHNNSIIYGCQSATMNLYKKSQGSFLNITDYILKTNILALLELLH